jgi:hypothetical protein
MWQFAIYGIEKLRISVAALRESESSHLSRSRRQVVERPINVGVRRLSHIDLPQE